VRAAQGGVVSFPAPRCTSRTMKSGRRFTSS
jgi:hypothetical protein